MYLWPWCLPYGHIVIWFIHSLIWWPGEREKFSFIYPHTEEAWFSHGFSFFLNSLLSLWSNVKEFIFFLSESLRATCQLVRWWWGWGQRQLFKREGLLYSSSLCYENPIWPTGMSVGLMYRTKLAEYLNLHTYSVGTRANVRQFEFFSFFLQFKKVLEIILKKKFFRTNQINIYLHLFRMKYTCFECKLCLLIGFKSIEWPTIILDQ